MGDGAARLSQGIGGPNLDRWVCLIRPFSRCSAFPVVPSGFSPLHTPLLFLAAEAVHQHGRQRDGRGSRAVREAIDSPFACGAENNQEVEQSTTLSPSPSSRP